MGLQKTIVKTIDLQCDGPCKIKIRGTVVPGNWSKVKLQDARQFTGQKPRYAIAMLCPSCAFKLVHLLRGEGFDFIDVNGGK